MHAKTKIVVLHMKELVYTGLLLLLGILFIVLLFIMFMPCSESSAPEAAANEATYIPGVYSCSVSIGNETLEIQVAVDEKNINSITLKPLSETVATMYPLIQTSFDELISQVYETQDLSTVQFPEETRYTSTMLLDAISLALKKAKPTA